ncbi:MAG: GtrA family protein [Actinomycetes bacterium]
MVDLVHRIQEWSKSHEGKKLIRFTAVSVISTGVSFVTLFLVFGVFKVWTQVPSTIFANAVATIPSYNLNRKWAWGKSGRSHLMKEILPFWSMSAVGIAVSVVGAQAARHVSVKHHLPHLEQTIIVLVANVLSFAIFWVLKLLLFNRLFHVNEMEEFDEHLELEEHELPRH